VRIFTFGSQNGSTNLFGSSFGGRLYLARVSGLLCSRRYLPDAGALNFPGAVLKEPDVTEDEIEAVAEELAKAGGASWYPGRQHGPLLKVVSDRYRDRARLAIAALDRYRAQKAGSAPLDSDEAEQAPVPVDASAAADGTLQVGATVVYRPPGEQRAYPCRVEKIEGGRAYLVPQLRAWTGWVPIEHFSPVASDEGSNR
jgi:hypothetical protein